MFAAQQSVERLVEERWAAAGADRSRWPLAAQDELENAEARLSALLTAQKEAQAQLTDAKAAAESDRRARTAAERAAEAAEASASRQQRESEQRVQRAEAAAAAAALQVSEFRRALAGVERERDELAAERAQRERASREAAAAVAGARRRTGDGGLAADGSSSERVSSLAGAGSAALPSPASSDALPSPLPSVRLRDTLESTDVLYLKNVLMKFIDAQVRWAPCGRWRCGREVYASCKRPIGQLARESMRSSDPWLTPHPPTHPRRTAAGAPRSARCCSRRWPRFCAPRRQSTGCCGSTCRRRWARPGCPRCPRCRRWASAEAQAQLGLHLSDITCDSFDWCD